MRLKTLGPVLPALLCACLSLSSCDQALDAQASSKPATQVYSPELRAKIDALKVELPTAPTTKANAQERAMLLWAWANAYALAGNPIPVDLPVVVAGLNMVPPPPPGTEKEPVILGFPVYKTIDHFFRELAFHDDDPKAIGQLRTTTPGPFPAGSFQTFVQVYKVGSQGLQPGAGILTSSNAQSDWITPQVSDPKGDNYITVKASRKGAHFSIDSYALAGQHGGSNKGGFTEQLVFRLEGKALKPGDTVTLTYGDKSGGSRGMAVQIMSNSQMPFPVYVDFKGNDDFFALPLQSIAVIGVKAESVQAFAPSIMAPGEKFTLHLRAQDKYGNKAEAAVPGYDVFLDGSKIATTKPGDSLAVIENVSIASPGTYRFEIHALDGSTTALSNPVWVEANPQRRIYWGETHAHSGFAEGIGTPDELQRFARDEAHLDFIGHSEHDGWMDDYEWKTLQEMTEKYNNEGKFLSILAYEWTALANNGGHHNVLFRTSAGRNRIPIQTYPKQADLYKGLTAENDMKDVLIIPHAHIPGDWRKTEPGMERLVEITSTHGTFEWFGKAYLNEGAQVGFVGASDDHTSHPGLAIMRSRQWNRSSLAAVSAPSLTTDAIFDALRDRRTYATTGARILMNVNINGTEPGKRAAFSPDRHIQAKISATAPLTSVVIVKNGTDIWTGNLGVVTNGTPTKRLRVNFTSSSEPFQNSYDTGRGWHFWEGTIKVDGAAVKSVIPEGIHSPLYYFARQSAQDPSLIEFSIGTRGTVEGFVIDLNDISANATLKVHVNPSEEGTEVNHKNRKNFQLLAGGDFTFAVSDIVKGVSERVLTYDDFYHDLITMHFDDGKPIYDVNIDETDRSNPKPGDYYYIRALQVDGHEAWSSPIWIGNREKSQAKQK